MMDPPMQEQTEADFLEGELSKMTAERDTLRDMLLAVSKERDTLLAALRAIVALAPRCDEGDCGDIDNCEDPWQEGKHRIVHATTFWGVPVYLCAEHAITRAESHQKAESKGSGKQPEIVPYVEQNQAIGIARLALAALESTRPDPNPDRS